MSFEKLKADYSHSALVAGLIAVIVSYAGPLAIVFQAGQSANLSPELISSWVWAISIGSALSGICLTWYLKIPVITAWSTPGAALLVTSLSLYSFPEAIGAYLISGVLIFIFGITGLFQTLMAKVPRSLSSAMLAGILFQFGVSVFTSMQVVPELVLPVILAYLVCKRLFPRYSIMAALTVGISISFIMGMSNSQLLSISLAVPVFTIPEFSIAATIGLAIPLFIVTMTSQNVPGVAVLKTAGYKPSINPIILGTGLASILLAPFGAHGINLAAITAAICTGPESHEEPKKRYVAGLFCGAFYLSIGMFGAAIASVFSTLPEALIATVAGLALFASLSNGLMAAMEVEAEREAALITFLVTVSGVSIWGIGSVFWGLIAGLIAYFVLVRKKTEPSQSEAAKTQQTNQ